LWLKKAAAENPTHCSIQSNLQREVILQGTLEVARRIELENEEVILTGLDIHAYCRIGQ